MNLRVQIRTPFRHQFRVKDLWLTAYEDYYLDSVKDKDEIKYLLSDLFPFREFIYIEPSHIDKLILEEVEIDKGNLPVGPSPEETRSHLIPTDLDMRPPQEPAPNPFIPDYVAPVVVEEEEQEEVLAEPFVLDSVPAEDDKVSKEDREKELKSFNAKKVREIAESYGLDYTNKEDTIDQILIMEY